VQFNKRQKWLCFISPTIGWNNILVEEPLETTKLLIAKHIVQSGSLAGWLLLYLNSLCIHILNEAFDDWNQINSLHCPLIPSRIKQHILCHPKSQPDTGTCSSRQLNNFMDLQIWNSHRPHGSLGCVWLRSELDGAVPSCFHGCLVAEQAEQSDPRREYTDKIRDACSFQSAEPACPTERHLAPWSSLSCSVGDARAGQRQHESRAEAATETREQYYLGILK
jgi:hypothetical protein